ncbi:MAG TPA: lipid-binding SYLF domain-containing protein [Geminicoccaceae bacterium]|nr:lipid-binding SYLF domain-containing protein [Geminicoccaceae bacterium]
MVGPAKRMVAVLGLALFGLLGPVEQAGADGQERVVVRARVALDSFLDDPNFAEMRVYVQNAYAVLIVPELLKAGFFFGAEHGIGVLLVRNPQTGAWGQPAFYALYAGSFGLQFGGQTSDVVFTLMNEGAVDKLIAHGVKLGADAGVAAGRLGAGVGAATTTHLGEDIYAFAKNKGLFGGFWLDGAYIVAKDDWNAAYYGRPVDAREIVRQPTVVASAEISALHQSLARF